MGGAGREVGVAGDCKGQVRTLAPGEGGGAWRAGLGGRQLPEHSEFLFGGSESEDER